MAMPAAPGDADAGVLVGVEDLLDVALGDEVAHGRAAVAGHDDAAGERERDDRRAVRRLGGQRCDRRRAPAGEQVGRVVAEELGERRRARRQVGGRQPPGARVLRHLWVPSPRSDVGRAGRTDPTAGAPCSGGGAVVLDDLGEPLGPDAPRTAPAARPR